MRSTYRSTAWYTIGRDRNGAAPVSVRQLSLRTPYARPECIPENVPKAAERDPLGEPEGTVLIGHPAPRPVFAWVQRTVVGWW
jgi:hypothetical protein